MPRIHIVGASGSGVSTLGVEIARLLSAPYLDADAVYWLPTDPPFIAARTRDERLALLRERLLSNGDWVFCGSAIGWAEPIEQLYDLIVYLQLDHAIRMDRLRRREQARYGRRIEPGATWRRRAPPSSPGRTLTTRLAMSNGAASLMSSGSPRAERQS